MAETEGAAGAGTDEVAVPAVKAGFLSFPETFTFGAASAAYQIEGAWNEGGRATSIWDDLTHFPFTGLQNGDVACDHYHRFRDDVTIMSKLGLKAYRFSICWPRLIPTGEGDVNPEGVKFYSDLIDALLAKGIEPWVTLYHWDLPSKLNLDFAGWLGPPERMTRAFASYARTCFRLFGDRVKRWMTLNEPWCVAFSYADFYSPWPNRKGGESVDPYTASHRMLLAHAEAVRIYRSEFQEQGGQIGMALNLDWVQPKKAGDPVDEAAAQRGRDFQLGCFADPVYFGDWPASMKAACGSRLPDFTEKEKELLKGSCDYFAINSYKTSLATPLGEDGKKGPCFNGTDKDAQELKDPDWEEASSSWSIVPWGFRDLLLYIQRRYNPPGGIAVTENGTYHETAAALELDKKPGALEPKPYKAGSPPKEDWDNETFDDPLRIRYLKAHLTAIDAARAGGADVRAYFVWSILDNFEWFDGYRPRMGIVRVDYETQKRTIKASGRWYADVIRSHGFEAPPKSEQYKGTPF